MFFGDINTLLLLLLFLISTIITNANTSLHLLLTAELIWINLYALTLLVGLIFDNLNLLSLTFFFLIFSAVEFAVGLVLMLIQHLLTRSLNLNMGGNLSFQFETSSRQYPLTASLSWKS